MQKALTLSYWLQWYHSPMQLLALTRTTSMEIQ